MTTSLQQPYFFQRNIFRRPLGVEGRLKNHSALPFQSQRQHARRNQSQAYPFLRAGAFVQKDYRHQRDQNQAEFIDGGDLRGVAQLQGFEVGEPGCAGGEAGENQECPVATSKPVHALPFAGIGQEQDQRGEDDQRADEGGEIRIYALQTHFGENRRQRGEARGCQCPEKPCVAAHVCPFLLWIVNNMNRIFVELSNFSLRFILR